MTLTAIGPVIRMTKSFVVCWVLHTLIAQSTAQTCTMERCQNIVGLTKFGVEETRRILLTAGGTMSKVKVAAILD